MNPKNHDHPTPDNSDNSAWEEAMSRDFDARVRDLHEAPLDFGSVKGKAHAIKRNRRAAVAGGILGVAAIVTPIAVLSNGGDADSDGPPVVNDPTETIADTTSSAPDYVLDGTWHQADGDTIKLPTRSSPYDSAVLWNDSLVATYWDGEVYANSDVISADGTVVDTLRTTYSVVVNDAGTTIAWIDPDTSEVMTAWDGGEVSLGPVNMSAPGETVAWEPAAIEGGADCLDNDESPACVVYLNSNLGEDSRSLDSYGIDGDVASGVTKVFDATEDGTVAVRTKTTEDLDTCGALFDRTDGTIRWETCDYQVQQISPDGGHVAAPQSQYDGQGPTSLSVLDAATGEETGRYAAEGGFIHTWAWTSDGHLLLDVYDGANWHLLSMATDGSFTEIVKPVKGGDLDNPFTLIQR